MGRDVTVDLKSAEFSDPLVNGKGINGPVIICLLVFFFLASLDAFQLMRNCLVNSLISLPSRMSIKIKKEMKQTKTNFEIEK